MFFATLHLGNRKRFFKCPLPREQAMQLLFYISHIVLKWHAWSKGESCQNTQSQKKGKDQESIQSSTTPEPGYQWESDNVTIRHHKREPIGQPFPITRHQQTDMH